MDKKRGTNACTRCGKPVYFAERKTSLGKDWHPNCLRCQECGKILTPGQHAEHKGIPYCHKPCYGALFGPQILGYGSNVSSPANFIRKSADISNDSFNSSFGEDSSDGLTCIFKTTHTSPGPLRFQRLDGEKENVPKLMKKRHSSGNVMDPHTGSSSSTGSSGYHSNAGSSSSSSGLDSNGVNSDSGGLKCVYQSSDDSRNNGITNKNGGITDSAPQTNAGRTSQSKDNGAKKALSPKKTGARGAELFKRVQSYNEFHQNKRGQALSIVEDESNNARVQGPLRIYWGLKKPIMLKQYDEVPAVPAARKRFSVITDQKDLKPLPEIRTESDSPKSPRKQLNGGGGGGFDDSVLQSPVADVVMRRTNIKKSNTVAYRGDSSKPNRWKRASINGHIYNYDTSVFTPVLGSCTSVTVDNKMTSSEVIKTLLDKFKVENEPEEFNLSIITEKESQRLLRDGDVPLMERLVYGPSDSMKIYIQDRSDKPALLPTHIPGDSSPTVSTPTQETPLPEEVEQLLDIPEPVLRGLLQKFKGDEEVEVRRLKAKYERIRRRVQQIIDDKKANVSRC